MRLRTIGGARALLRAMVTAVSVGVVTLSGVALAQQQPPPFAPPVLAPAPAEQAPAPHGNLVSAATAEFGSVGQLTLNADLQFSIIHQGSSGSATPSGTSVLIQPGADYFLMQNFSVGGLLSYAYNSAASIGTTTIGFQVRAGYNLKINDTFSFWPRLGIGYFHGSTSFAGMDSSAYDLPLQLFAPVLWNAVPHFFIGFGPTLTTDLAATDEKLTFVGVQLVVGGYFGLN